MAIYKNISSKAIIRKIFRDLNPNTDNWIDDAIEWIGEALEHIGASTQLVKKTVIVDIKDYKGSMPGDLYYINQVAINTSNEAESMANQLDLIRDELNNILEGGANSSAQLNQVNARLHVLEDSYTNTNNLTLLAYCTTNFPKNIHCENCVNEMTTGEDCYYIDDNMIKTSFPKGKVCLSYMAFPLDEDCFPMVPDDISFKEAMFWYVYKQMLLGGMPATNNGIGYDFADNKWRFYCTQARNAANYPDIDRYESFMDQWVRLIPNINRHAEGFAALGARESLDRSGKYGVRSQLGSSPKLNRTASIPAPTTEASTEYKTLVFWTFNTESLSAVSTTAQVLKNPLEGFYTINDNPYNLQREDTYWSLDSLSPNQTITYNFTIGLTTVGNCTANVNVYLGESLMESFVFDLDSSGSQTISGAAEAVVADLTSAQIRVEIFTNTILYSVKLNEGNIKIY